MSDYIKFCLAGVIVVGVFALFGVKAHYQGQLIEQRTVATKPLPNKLARVVAVGDLSCDDKTQKTDKECRFDEVAKAIQSVNPDKVLLLGDLQYQKGEAAQFAAQFDAQWKDLKGKSLSVPGNHEYQTKDAAGYFDYWNGASQTSAQAGDRMKGYYTADVGDWQVLGLNSNCEVVACDEQSEQGKWLKSQLESSPRCTLAMWHHPRFTSGKYANDTNNTDRSKYFWEQLSAKKADIVLNGHDHIYERFARQNALAEQTQNGVRQFISGAGGRSLYDQKRVAKNQEKILLNQFGFLQLDLSSIGYQWKFININGQVLDSGSSRCAK